MRIKNLKVHNFRSIRELEIECLPFVTLIGPNNHGKSNLLSALEFVLSTSAKPVEHDFFINRSEKDNTLWVEITFHELTKQEKNTLNKYVLSNGTVIIRKTAVLQNGGVEIFYNGYVEEPSEEWLKSDYASEYTARAKVNQIPLKDMVPPGGRLTKAIIESAQRQYIDQHICELSFSRTLESSPLLGQKNVGGGVLPDYFLIPAIRDLTEEIKVKTTTTFGRLLSRAIQEMAERDQRFIDVRKNLQEIVQSLNLRDVEYEKESQLATLEKSIEEELSVWGVKVNIEVTPPELERLFELGTDIYLDDGVKTTANRKGHGLQRAMIYALLLAWAKSLKAEAQQNDEEEMAPRKQSDSIIFAMEEPELFLHPHAQRKLMTSLREIADASSHQIFICTHSPYFVNLDYYKEVAIVTKYCSETGSCLQQCVEDLFEGENIQDRKKRFHMAQWINPYRSEMFFAKRVIFVEGETEKVVLPYLANKIGLFNPDVSVIDCGSKHNLPLYIKIAKAFKIPYLIIHDEDPVPDPLPENWDETKIREKRRTYGLNQKIEDLVENPLGEVEVFSPDFEGVSGISSNQIKNKGKALAALDYFESINEINLPERIKQVVCAAFGKGDHEK